MASWKDIKNVTESNIGDEKYGFWETLARLFTLNFKVMYKTNMIWMLCILLPFFLALGFSVFLPLWFSYTLIMYITLLLTTGITFGSLMYTYTTTTMKMNMSLTSVKKETTIFSIWLSMMMMSFISTCVAMLAMIFWENIGIAGTQMSFQEIEPNPSINWARIDWAMIFYYWFIFTSIMFTFSLFVQRWINSRNTYYVFLMTYLIFTLFVGGTLSFSWHVVDGDVEFIKVGEEQEYVGALDPFLKGSPMYFVAQFFPTTHINEFGFSTVLKGLEGVSSNEKLSYMVENANSINMFVPHGSDWRFMFIMPYLYMVLYYILYRITSIIE